MSRQFDGKVALITGGSTGLGRAAAVAFAREGAKCVITYNSSENEAKRTIALMEDAGGKAIAVKADLTRSADAEAMVAAAIKTYGRLDFAYNNGFQAKVAPIADMTEADFDFTDQGVFKSVWLSMKYEITQMRKQGGGVIVNCGASVHQVCERGLGVYAAAKAAITQLTRMAATEHGPDIRINIVSPGLFDTPAVGKGAEMMKSVPPAQAKIWREYGEIAHKYQAIPRMGRPEECASAVLWLCSDAASYVTGANFAVDGGISLR